mgnify:CR=1 FL=1
MTANGVIIIVIPTSGTMARPAPIPMTVRATRRSCSPMRPSRAIATAIAPAAQDFLVAGHAGAEPGITAALDLLGLPALLDLGMRLGEGSGAVLALPIVQAAAHILAEMATFEDAAVTDIKVTGEVEIPAQDA